MVANRYIIEKKIGKGSFGEVYKGYDKETKSHVAIKVELAKTLKTRALIEGRILKKLQGYEGIPQLYHFGTEGDYNVLVIELLGPNLEDLINYCDHQLSMKTVLMIGDQLVKLDRFQVKLQIQRMEAIHNRGFIHRDIKSDNFLIGCNEHINKVYMIDFGLGKRYFHPHTGEHIPVKMHKGLIGTARFASINAHLGLEQSRRDDLQALGYLMVYLAKGSLPWQKTKAKNQQQKYKRIFEIKDSYTPEALCDGLPEEFALYINYVKRLEFEEKPDYSLYRQLFLNLLTRQGVVYDLLFDWMIPRDKRKTYRRQIRRKFKTTQVDGDKQVDKKEIDGHIKGDIEIQEEKDVQELPKDEQQSKDINIEQQEQITIENMQQVQEPEEAKDQQDNEQYQHFKIEISQQDIIKRVAIDIQDCDANSSQKQQNNTTHENIEEKINDIHDKFGEAQKQINDHIMQKVYMKADQQNQVNAKLLEVIQERYDEITPYEKSEILHRLGQHSYNDLLNPRLRNKLNKGQRKQTEYVQIELDPNALSHRLRRALSYEHKKHSDKSLGIFMQGSLVSGEEDIALEEDDVQLHNVAYEFNVKLYNPLQVDKQLTPSPIKARALSGPEAVIKLQNWKFRNQLIGSQNNNHFDPHSLMQRRLQRNSVDVIRTNKSKKNQESSMYTEYDNSFMNPNQINDIDSSNGTPVNNQPHLIKDTQTEQHNSPYQEYNNFRSTEKLLVSRHINHIEKSQDISEEEEEESVSQSVDDNSTNLLDKNKSCLLF